MDIMNKRVKFNTNKYETKADVFTTDLMLGNDTLIEYSVYNAEQSSRILGYGKRLIELRLKSQKAF